MRKEAVVLVAVAGVMLFVRRPLTISELNTVRMRLQVKIEAVEKKIDKLSRQVQTLNEKIDRLDHRFAAMEKHFNIEQWQDSTEAMEETIPHTFEECKVEIVHSSEVIN